MIQYLKNINRPGIIALLVLFLLSWGFLFGWVTGRYTVGEIVTRKPRYAAVLHRSARDLFTISMMLNSPSEMKRLSGYYGLYENRLIETDFLIERLEKETSPVVRRTIIWLLGESKDENTALKALAGAYGSDNPHIRNEVLRSMERLDPDYYGNFLMEVRGGKKGATRR